MADAPEPNLFAGIGEEPAPAAIPPQAQAPTAPPQQQAAPPPGAQQEPNLFSGVGEVPPAAPPAPAAPPDSAPITTGNTRLPGGTDDYGRPVGDGQTPQDGGLGEGLATGAAQAVFNTKDAITTGFGTLGNAPAEGDRSAIRQGVDALASDASKSLLGGWSNTLAQVGVGLLGAGKITAAVKGGAVVGSALAALAQTVTLDPHAANIANLVQAVPGLDNGVTRYLASDPKDSAAAGYMKNAMASLGFDAAAIGTLTGVMGLYRALSKGSDAAAIEAAHAELEAAMKSRADGIGAARSADAAAPPSGEASGAAIGSASGAPDAGAAGLKAIGDELGVDAGDHVPDHAGDLGLKAVSDALGGGEDGADAGAVVSDHPATMTISDDQVAQLLTTSHADTQALIERGSWDAAVASGHTFGDGGSIPWQKVSGANTGDPETSLDAFIARVADAKQAEYDAAKGGAVQTDAMNRASVMQRYELWGQDPAALMGRLEMASDQANQMRADMDAAFAVGQRAMQDAWAMSSRIKAGYLDEWGGDVDTATAAFKEHTELAATLYSYALSIQSNAGRTVRGAGAAHALDPSEIAAMRSMDGASLVDFFAATEGNPRAIGTLLQPSLWKYAAQWPQYLMINGLISNPLTHAIIAASNTWQTLARPAMRAMGTPIAKGVAFLQGADDAQQAALSTAGQAAQKQYGYLATAIPDSLRAAMQAWKAGDSILSPHAAEATALPLGQTIAQLPFKPVSNLSDVLSNALTFIAKTVAVPSRIVGVQDEFVKQLNYRAIVSAKAEIDGADTLGLTGQDLADHVRGALFDAFDASGQASDADALAEAKTATFQNDLQQTGNWGWATAGAKTQQLTQNFPPAQVVLPFVKTPTNLFRQAVQLTPGLNLLQKEFRDGLSGALGPDAQTLASGQMAMGSLLMGAAGMMAYQGLVTGSEPSNPELKAALLNTGWRPNSIVIPHADGSKTYLQFNRLDPIAMPFSMAADIVSVLKSPAPADQWKATNMLGAMATGMLKNLTDKTYLQNIQRTIDAIDDPDRSLGKWAGQMASGFVPFSFALRVANPDPYMREARDFVDRTLESVPGYSSTLDPRRDWAGDPVTVHKGLWINTKADRVDAEIQRMTTEQGVGLNNPPTTAPGGADLRNITLAGNNDPSAAGRSAYDRMQELAGHPALYPSNGTGPGTPSLRETVTKLMESPEYQAAPDGSGTEQGTKLGMVAGVVSRYRRSALQFMATDNNVREAEQAEHQRVATAYGATSTPLPTATNQEQGIVSRMLSNLGIRSGPLPAPVAPNLSTTTGQQP